ncbi:G-protein coupled receptors family 1 profile domain-containing protein [Pleurotus pulmonarius]
MASQSQAGSSSPNISLIVIFDFTQIFGFVLLCIVLLTAALVTTVRRSPAWFNFLSTWVLSCISYLATLGQQTGEMPHFSICLLQAMLVYAAPAVTVTAGLCFIIEMWRIVTRVGASSGRGPLSFRDYRILIVAPYVVHLIICVEVLVLGLTRRELVTRDKTYMFCHLDSALPAYVTGSVVICAILIAMAFVASTAIHIRKHMAASRLFQGQQVANIQKMVVRFAIFTVLPVFGLALSVAQVSARPTGVADGILTIAIGTLPAGAALIFGTQSDLMRVWCFWRRSTMSKNPLEASARKTSQSV